MRILLAILALLLLAPLADARGMYCSRHPSADSCACSARPREPEYSSQHCVDYRAEREAYYASDEYKAYAEQWRAEQAQTAKRDRELTEGLGAVFAILVLGVVAAFVAWPLFTRKA